MEPVDLSNLNAAQALRAVAVLIAYRAASVSDDVEPGDLVRYIATGEGPWEWTE